MAGVQYVPLYRRTFCDKQIKKLNNLSLTCVLQEIDRTHLFSLSETERNSGLCVANLFFFGISSTLNLQVPLDQRQAKSNRASRRKHEARSTGVLCSDCSDYHGGEDSLCHFAEDASGSHGVAVHSDLCLRVHIRAAGVSRQS